jgi:hypothetical protein
MMHPTARVSHSLRWRALILLALSALLPSVRAATAAAPPVSAVLQACPSVKQEIVDLDMLAEGLKHSDAVGFFDKVRLKTSIDGLIARMKDFHRGKSGFTLAQLQEQYDVLLMNIAAKLQDKDLALHSQLCNAWASIWDTLQDRKRFMETFS